MGQKTNPNIFRLGGSQTWKTEFFEKKSQELPLYTFKDLEIKSYIERVLKLQGILLHDYKQFYNTSTFYLYISYFILPDFSLQKNDKGNIATLILNNSQNEKKVRNKTKTSIFNLANVGKYNVKSMLFRNTSSSKSFYKLKQYFKVNSLEFKNNDLTYRNQKNIFRQNLNTKMEGLLANIFKVLSLFTNKKLNIAIHFCCLNKNLTFLKSVQKKNFILLQKYKNTPFLKEGIELMFQVVYNRNSAKLLAKFVAMQIRKVKRHKFFLFFLKHTLTVLTTSNLSKVKGIKIILKGRLNGVRRARHKTITIGDVPVQSLNDVVDYYQTTTNNSNGSYGIKVWIIEKQ